MCRLGFGFRRRQSAIADPVDEIVSLGVFARVLLRPGRGALHEKSVKWLQPFEKAKSAPEYTLDG